jgi:hypothetical protein
VNIRLNFIDVNKIQLHFNKIRRGTVPRRSV